MKFRALSRRCNLLVPFLPQFGVVITMFERSSNLERCTYKTTPITLLQSLRAGTSWLWSLSWSDPTYRYKETRAEIIENHFWQEGPVKCFSQNTENEYRNQLNSTMVTHLP